MTTVLIAGFFGYGHAWNAAVAVPGQPMAAHRCVGAAGRHRPLRRLAIRRMGANRVSRAQPGRRRRPAAQRLERGRRDGRLRRGRSASPGTHRARAGSPDPSNLPDVYYIILDRYAGSAALAETYDFDNEPFLTALEARGFDVARKAHANYIKTPLSIASSLNLDYLDADALKAEATEGKDREPIHRVLRDHLVVPTALKELGYQYIHVSNWWTPYRHQRRCRPDVPVQRPGRVLDGAGPDDPAARVQRARVGAHRPVGLARPARAHPLRARPAGRDSRHGRPEVRLRARAASARPVRLQRRWDLYRARAGGSAWPAGELPAPAQLCQHAHAPDGGSDPGGIRPRCGDHAAGRRGPLPGALSRGRVGLPVATGERRELEEKFGILYAMRVPGADLESAGFHDTITPVNTFRLIFNARFGTDLPCSPIEPGRTRTSTTSTTSSRSPIGSGTDERALQSALAPRSIPARRHLSRRHTCSRRTPRPR